MIEGPRQVPHKSWPAWFTKRRERQIDAEAEKQAKERIARAVAEALANERREAWWRIAEAHGWKGGTAHAAVVPADEVTRFRRFWDGIGAQRHVTEGA